MTRRQKRRLLIAIPSALFLAASIGVPTMNAKVSLPPVEAVAVAGMNPGVCVGYNPEKNAFGEEWRSCPAGYAFMTADDAAGPAGPARIIGAHGACCPLPANDMLSEQHVFSEDACPEDHVATGAKGLEKGHSGAKYLRCTRINTDRYQLGEMTPGIYWGNGFAGWQGSRRIEWEDIPAGLRYAAGRQNADRWDIDGCVGYPWGSLLAKKESKYCAGMLFRQVQFKGAPGDPPAGTPVKMFADCDEITNVNDPVNARCVKRQGGPVG